MEELAWILCLMTAFIVVPLVLWSRRVRRLRQRIPAGTHISDPNTRQESVVPTSGASTERATTGGRGRMRRRPALTVVASVASVGSSSSSSSSAGFSNASPSDIHDGGDDEDEIVDATYYKPKQSKKKNERKHEKEMRREAESAARDMRKEKEERMSQLRRQKDEEREAEEKRKEEEAEALKQKEAEKAAVEFDKWKSAFSVEGEGQEQAEEDEGAGLLNNFIDYIKKHKCVALEDLAAEFSLRTRDCISRLMELEQMGRISGVMDDRGKFIYISPEEMKAVADYIKRLGRVSISHLASKSNEFIDVEEKLLASDCAQKADVVAEPQGSLPQISVA